MIPEVSKLNWSTVKPTFEEVRGKTLVVDLSNGVDFGTEIPVIEKKSEFEYWFDEDFVRYAILDLTPPGPEPLPLWGEVPDVCGETSEPHLISYEWKGWSIETPYYPTRAEAIEVWNKISTRLADISP